MYGWLWHRLPGPVPATMVPSSSRNVRALDHPRERNLAMIIGPAATQTSAESTSTCLGVRASGKEAIDVSRRVPEGQYRSLDASVAESAASHVSSTWRS